VGGVTEDVAVGQCVRVAGEGAEIAGGRGLL